MKFLHVSRRAPGSSRTRVIFWWTFVRGLVRLFFKLAYRLHERGTDSVPATGPIVYVSNHQSHFDPCIVGIPTGDRPLAGMARATLFRFRPLAWVMRSIGAVELERDRGDAGAMKAALGELAAGRCVMIYPEGTRTRDGALGQFKRGVMLLIRRAAPATHIVPVAIEGAYDVWPVHRALPRLTGRIAVSVGAPIAAAELSAMEPDEALGRLKRAIEAMRLELRGHLRHTTAGRYPAPGVADVAYWDDTPSQKRAGAPATKSERIAAPA